MKRLIASPLLAAVFRWILGLIFIYASIHKIADPIAFSETIYNYQIMPDMLVNFFAIWLPWLELFAGFSLIIGIWIKGGALIISILSTAFAIAVGSAIFRGLDISCGCFSLTHGRAIIQWTHLSRNLVLFVIGLQVLFFDKGKYALNYRKLCDPLRSLR